MADHARGKSRFVAVFVNEMFAILLGLGLVEVFFSSGFQLTNPVDVISLSFVVSVVIFYWWEWSESIDEQFVTTARDFVINLLILCVFFLMFRSFCSPLTLAGLLIVLALLDLVWVTNFVITTRLFRHASRGVMARWFARKFLAILVFVGSYQAIVHWTDEAARMQTEATGVHESVLLGDTAPALLEGAERERASILAVLLVAVPFYVVRWTCFGVVKRMPRIVVSEACPCQEDIDDIVRIHNQYVHGDDLQAGAEGFLLQRLSRRMVKKEMEREGIVFHLVATVGGRVIGYAKVGSVLPPECDAVRWQDPDIRETLQQEVREGRHTHVYAVALDRRETGKHHAMRLYRRLRTIYGGHGFSAFVATDPTLNLPSLGFHQKMGFVDVGTYENPSYLGIENYRSRFLYRDARVPDPPEDDHDASA
jgi:L-amino acid N-acyltransferase YncA